MQDPVIPVIVKSGTIEPRCSREFRGNLFDACTREASSSRWPGPWLDFYPEVSGEMKFTVD